MATRNTGAALLIAGGALFGGYILVQALQPKTLRTIGVPSITSSVLRPGQSTRMSWAVDNRTGEDLVLSLPLFTIEVIPSGLLPSPVISQRIIAPAGVITAVSSNNWIAPIHQGLYSVLGILAMHFDNGFDSEAAQHIFPVQVREP